MTEDTSGLSPSYAEPVQLDTHGRSSEDFDNDCGDHLRYDLSHWTTAERLRFDDAVTRYCARMDWSLR